jgi:hypothetical protein
MQHEAGFRFLSADRGVQRLSCILILVRLEPMYELSTSRVSMNQLNLLFEYR